MLTLERLFGHIPASADLLEHTPFLQRARSERERGREASSQVALGAYLVARLVARLHELGGSTEAREGFAWQAQSTRQFIRELPGTEPEQAHLLGVAESADVEGSPASLRMSLAAYAYFLEQEGRYEEALEALALSAASYRESVSAPDFVGLALSAGRIYRHLARWDDANRAYSAAGETAQSVADARSVLLSRLGRANVLRGRGNLPAARTEVEAIIGEAAQPELRDVQARAYNDLASVFNRLGEGQQAVVANYRAFQLYQDSVDRFRTLGDLAICLRELGVHQSARDALIMVRQRCDHWMLRTNALVELIELESSVGDELAFHRLWREAATLVERMPPSMAVDYHFKVGVGSARFGSTERARTFLARARELAEEHQLHAWYFRVDSALSGLAAGPAAEPAPTPAGDLGSPAVAEVTAGLRELVSASA